MTAFHWHYAQFRQEKFSWVLSLLEMPRGSETAQQQMLMTTSLEIPMQTTCWKRSQTKLFNITNYCGNIRQWCRCSFFASKLVQVIVVTKQGPLRSWLWQTQNKKCSVGLTTSHQKSLVSTIHFTETCPFHLNYACILPPFCNWWLNLGEKCSYCLLKLLSSCILCRIEIAAIFYFSKQ